MTLKLTEKDLELLAEKEASRERDRQTVAEGKCTWVEMNQSNSWATSVIHFYRPVMKSIGKRPRR